MPVSHAVSVRRALLRLCALPVIFTLFFVSLGLMSTVGVRRELVFACWRLANGVQRLPAEILNAIVNICSRTV